MYCVMWMTFLYVETLNAPKFFTGQLSRDYVPQPLNHADHKAYRAIVGKLLWLALIGPDISYATKELSNCREI